MNWLEVSLTASAEAAEAVAEVLSRYAQGGVVFEAGPCGLSTGPVTVRAYLSADEHLEASKRRVAEGLWHLSQIVPIPAPIFRPVADSDWAEAWKANLTVVRVGRHTVICPSWLDYAPSAEDVVVRLDPGMAFGTGLHPTTQLCLARVEELVRPGTTVLDLGTGSGILAIAAAKLGGEVLAIDNDRTALKTALENVAANEVQSRVHVVQGSLAEAERTYDVVFVNILAQVIVKMLAEGLVTRVRSDGTVVTSGILSHQKPEVDAALKQAGLVLSDDWQQEDWVCVAAKNREPRPG